MASSVQPASMEVEQPRRAGRESASLPRRAACLGTLAGALACAGLVAAALSRSTAVGTDRGGAKFAGAPVSLRPSLAAQPTQQAVAAKAPAGQAPLLAARSGDRLDSRPENHLALRMGAIKSPVRVVDTTLGADVGTAKIKAASSMLMGSIRLGSSRPRSLVAMFPGIGMRASQLRDLASGWYAQHPDTQFILINTDAFSPDRAFYAACSLVPRFYDGLVSDPLNSPGTPVTPAVDGYSAEAKSFDPEQMQTNFFGDVLLTCCNEVSYALGEVLSDLGLKDEDLILAGFSQGASVAAYTGFMRGASGVILMGGPGVTQFQLLPPPAQTPTEVCVVVGDADRFAPHAELAEAFRPYGDHVHVIPGLKHEITEDHVRLGGAFISSVLARADAKELVAV